MIVNRLPEVLYEKRMTLGQLAEITNTTYRQLIKLYYSDTVSVHFAVLDDICRALDCSVGDLFYYLPGETLDKPAIEQPPYKVHPRNKRIQRATILTKGA